MFFFSSHNPNMRIVHHNEAPISSEVFLGRIGKKFFFIFFYTIQCNKSTASGLGHNEKCTQKRRLLNWTPIELVLITLSVIPPLPGKIKLWRKSKVRKTPKKTLHLTRADSSEARAEKLHKAHAAFIAEIYLQHFLISKRRQWPVAGFPFTPQPVSCGSPVGM